MTLPLYTKNRAASSFHGNLQDPEANNMSTKAHKFAHLFCGIIAESSLIDTGIAELPDKCHLVDATNAGMANKRPLNPDQAVDVVDAARENYRMATPTSTPEPPAKRNRISCSNEPRSSCTFPTADDPMDDSFCMKLYSMGDEGKISPTHIVLRQDVVEIRRTKSGKIFFQCACCKHLPHGDRAKLSTLDPQSIGSLYRAFTRFQTSHVPACAHIPQQIKNMSSMATRDVKARKTKEYWVESAKKKGLRDGKGDECIIYCNTT
mmetsp:Transcript_1300/g.2544  ORF Transcript_1300/g.2544 Transcript_1300/m.2544 type:complete len:263 (-) Transcript_1300:335-1123(-)